MTVAVRIPSALRDTCANASELAVAATSVQAALEQLEQSYPALYRSVCDETGKVRTHVNLFVNFSHIRDCQDLRTPLKSGDILSIWPAVSGG